mmetsp:Transcript_33388/g.37989  ORF Transcript_33388/g.37989 Transcript_33388/m.37989 type:complete len:144 (-) Transcript_33388:133-564(-)
MSETNNPFSDNNSQASRSSLSGSLLDRIRAQREREVDKNNFARPEPLSVPNYSQIESNTAPTESLNGWSMGINFNRFGNIAESEATTSLLSVNDVERNSYSMTRYFQTFVHDVYSGFRSFHPFAQGVIVLLLVVAALKLIDII